MRNCMYRKRDAVLYAILAQELDYMGFSRCVLGCLVWRQFIPCSIGPHQHLQTSFSRSVKGHPASRKDASGRAAHAFNEHGKDSAWSQTEPWLTTRIAARNQRAMQLRPRSP